MSDTISLSFRIDKNLKEQADNIFNALGLTMTTALNVYINQVIRQGKIPFELSLGYSDETIQALEKSLDKKNHSKGFKNIDSLINELLKNN